ncbi:MAG: peptidoglycan bridge formation glycyltransferase FemA/FemB family protein [Candidatus Obscuribacterales bacterium]|nr:peptidoglycan bridge formation glycyltransferase FemA/FemB family protein [Candidatus Obscuribacterales bacterium]
MDKQPLLKLKAHKLNLEFNQDSMTLCAEGISSFDLAEQWNSLVEACSNSGFMQSLNWAKFKKHQGYRIIAIGLFQNDTLIGGALGYLPEKTNGQGIICIPEGPILQWQDEQIASEGLRLIEQAMENEALKAGAMALRIEPRLNPPVDRSLRTFKRAPVDLVPNETLCLDLNLSEQELLRQMHHKCRYNIGLAAKKNVVIREYRDASALNEFYPALLEAAQRDDFFAEPRSFFDGLCDLLCPSGMARIFIASHEEDILGGLLLLTFGKRATFLYGGITNTKRQLMAGYALQWRAIQAAKALNCDTYDFYGYTEFDDENHDYARFSRFKRQFGGKMEKFIGAHDHFFLDRLADVVIKAVNQVER